MKRLLLPAITIPYANITSIDWTRSRNIVVTLSESSIFCGMKKRYVMIRDTSGFLNELEHHVTPDVLHV
ncbi:MAG TPA: hypothetical protein VIM67_12145 [Terriglobus sp.]